MTNQTVTVLELKPAAGKWKLLLPLSLIIALYGFILLVIGLSNKKAGIISCLGLLSALYGTFGGAVSIMSLLPRRMSLWLTADGFTFATPWRRRFYDWHSVLQFNFGKRKVWFLLDDRPSKKMYFPETYRKTPAELAATLENWRNRSTQSELSDTARILIACSYLRDMPFPVILKTGWGPLLIGFKTMEDGYRYFGSEAGPLVALKTLSEAVRANPTAFSRSSRLLYMNTSDAVDSLLENPHQFPYEEFFIPLPKSLFEPSKVAANLTYEDCIKVFRAEIDEHLEREDAQWYYSVLNLEKGFRVPARTVYEHMNKLHSRETIPSPRFKRTLDDFFRMYVS